MNAKDVKKQAREFGADLIGIAPIGRFKSLSADRNPAEIFPECTSVIVVGRRILRGSIRGVEEGTNFGSTYNTFGFHWLEDNFLAQTTYDLTCWLETQGWEAVPLFGYSEEGMPKGVAVADGKPRPNVIVDMEFAAQAAGLAEPGLGGFSISPEYGTRQRFALILTDAELDADAVREKDLCGDCGRCADACPLHAIDLNKRHRAGVPGYEVDVAAVDYEVCRTCRNGAITGRGRGNRPDRIAAACGRACLVQLEQGGKCRNKFETPFRKRQPWAVDPFSRPIPAVEAATAR
ncbi:MAG: 4Fe-4S binding protein [Planctomycetota bacterium]